MGGLGKRRGSFPFFCTPDFFHRPVVNPRFQVLLADCRLPFSQTLPLAPPHLGVCHHSRVFREVLPKTLFFLLPPALVPRQASASERSDPTPPPCQLPFVLLIRQCDRDQRMACSVE